MACLGLTAQGRSVRGVGWGGRGGDGRRRVHRAELHVEAVALAGELGEHGHGVVPAEAVHHLRGPRGHSVGLGRIVALYHRSSTLYQILEYNRYARQHDGQRHGVSPWNITARSPRRRQALTSANLLLCGTCGSSTSARNTVPVLSRPRMIRASAWMH
jgi:hypothetical protein